MLWNVFDTEQQAINAERVDYNKHIAIYNKAKYVSQTTAWAIPRQRLDGKWVHRVCPWGVREHAEEEYNENWFPVASET